MGHTVLPGVNLKIGWGNASDWTLIPLSVSLWNNFGDPVFDGVGLADFENNDNASLSAYTAGPLLIFYCFLILYILTFYMCWYCRAGVFELIGCQSLSLGLALPKIKKIIIIIIIISLCSSVPRRDVWEHLFCIYDNTLRRKSNNSTFQSY